MDAPPAYADAAQDVVLASNTGQDQPQHGIRDAAPPFLNVTRYLTQGGPPSAKVASCSGPLRLVLSLHQRNHYKPGDIVSGTLELVSELASSQDIVAETISISLSGRCTTTKALRTNHNRRETLQLFADKRALFHGPATLHLPTRSAGTVAGASFPFQFTFPTSCNVSRASDFETGRFFNAAHSQPLPSSFTDRSHAEKASVAYELKAELLALDSKGYYAEGSLRQICTLNVYAPRLVGEPTVKFTPHIKTFSYQSLDLLSPEERKYHTRPLNIGQKLGIRSVSKDRQPKASFAATIFLPSVAVIGQPLLLIIHVEHYAERSSTTYSPTIHLKSLHAHLRKETSICSIKHRSGKAISGRTDWTTTVEIAYKELGERVPIVSHLDLRDVMDLTIDPNLHPSFKTYNIARTYSLKVTGTIICAGRSFAIWSQIAGCTLLAKEYEPHLPGYDEPTPRVEETNGDQPLNEGPPSYVN